VHLTTNPPSAPKRGKKIGPEVGRTSQGLSPQKWSIFGLRASSNRAPLPFKSVVAPPITSVIRSKQLAVRHQIASAEC